MMRYLSLCLFAFPISIHAGEKAAFIPLRYEGLNETKLLRLKEVLGHPEMTAPVGHTAVLSADGKLGLFVGGGSSDADGRTDESFLSLWDVPGGHALKEIRIPGKAVSALALAPDGKTALTGLYGNDGKGNETTDLVLWSFETGKALHRFEAPKRKEKEQPAVYIAVAFAPDGKRALASVTRGGVQLVDLEKRKVAATLLPGKEETGPALALLFPSNEHAVVGWGAEVHLWDLAKNVSRKSFSGNKEPVLSVALSADGKRLATASVEGVVRYWDTSTGKELSSLSREPSNNPLVSIAFAGANLLTVWTGADPATGLPSPGSVALWDPEAKKEIWKRKATLHGLVPIAVTGTEATLGGGANIFCRWDMKAGVEQKIWGGHKTPVTAVAVLKSGQVVSGGQDGVLKYWHGAAPLHLIGHADAVSVLRGGDGDRLLSGSADGTVKLWNMKTGETLKTFKGHEGNVTGAVFGPGGKWIASAGADRVIRTWDVETGKPIAVISGHSEGINGLAISPDGTTLATASDDNSVRLWPVKDGMLVKGADVVVLEGHKRQVMCVAFTPDGKRLLSGSQDKTIRVWNIDKERTEKVLEAHQNWVSSLLVWNDRAISAADDFRVIIWDLKKGKVEDVIDLTPYGDVPRCLALDADAHGFCVGTGSWVIMRFEELAKTK